MALLLTGLVIGCNGGKPASEAASDGAAKPGEASKPATPALSGKLSKLLSEDVTVGKGEPASNGDTVYVRYTGKLADGTVFDTNETSDKPPFTFLLGAGSVIKGWDQGVVGMKLGGKRKLSIPSDLGYGAQGGGDKIPPNADLYFDVELLDMVRKGDELTVVVEDLKTGRGPKIKQGDKVRVEYALSELSGKELDNSKNYKDKYFEFTLGAGEAIQGMELAVEGMQLGGERLARIPASLGPPPSPASGPMGLNAVTKLRIKVIKVSPGKGKG